MKKQPENIDHIGIAVQSIAGHLPFYEEILGLSLLRVEKIETQGVKVAFIKIGSSCIELLEPLTDDSPIAAFLEKKGEGIHHIALRVTDIDKRIREIQEDGIQVLNSKPYKGAAGADVAFLHPSATGRVLYEFCEKKQ